MVRGPPARAAAATDRPARPARVVGSPVVLDVVFIVGVLALFALVGAVAAGVEKL